MHHSGAVTERQPIGTDSEQRGGGPGQPQDPDVKELTRPLTSMRANNGRLSDQAVEAETRDCGKRRRPCTPNVHSSRPSVWEWQTAADAFPALAQFQHAPADRGSKKKKSSRKRGGPTQQPRGWLATDVSCLLPQENGPTLGPSREWTDPARAMFPTLPRHPPRPTPVRASANARYSDGR